MHQIFHPRSLKRAAPAAALTVGAVLALLIAVLPQWRLEAIVSASGLGDLVAAARPPLGATARSAMALASGAVVAALAHGALMLVLRGLPTTDAQGAERDVPVLRRADAHPDAPARRPLRASEDLGQPLPIGRVPREAVPPPRPVPQPVPADLDTPLAAVDPAAIPDVPRDPVRPVAPLARPALVESESFALTPIRRAPAQRVAPVAEAPTQPASLSALLDRLERGAQRREGRPALSVQDTIGLLRGLAAR